MGGEFFLHKESYHENKKTYYCMYDMHNPICQCVWHIHYFSAPK